MININPGKGFVVWDENSESFLKLSEVSAHSNTPKYSSTWVRYIENATIFNSKEIENASRLRSPFNNIKCGPDILIEDYTVQEINVNYSVVIKN